MRSSMAKRFRIGERMKIVGIFPGENPRRPYMFYYEADDGKIWYTMSPQKRGAVVAKNMREFVKMAKRGDIKVWLVKDGKVVYKSKVKEVKREEEPLDDSGREWLDDEVSAEFESYIDDVDVDGADQADRTFKKTLAHWKRTLGKEEYAYFVKQLTDMVVDWKRKNRVAHELVKVAKLLVGDEEEADAPFLKEIAVQLKGSLKRDHIENIKIDSREPYIHFTVYADTKGVKSKYRKEYNSPREFWLSVSLGSDTQVGTRLHNGAPGGPSYHLMGQEYFKKDAKKIAKWVIKLVKDDVKKAYTWDVKPEKGA